MTATPLPRNKATMLHGWLLRAELQKIAQARLERGEPIDWTKWCWIAAATMDAIQPGRERVLMMPSGHAYGGRYYRTWAQCQPRGFLCDGKHRLALTLDEVPDAILRAARAACERAGKRRFRIFMKGSTIARLLGVTSAERKRLGLRLIGSVDADKPKLKGAAMDRKKERDRLRDERKRREAGARPRGESLAQQARDMGISPATLRKRMQRERERVTVDVTLSSPLYSAENVTLSSPSYETENTFEKQSVNAYEMQHVTLSSPHKYTEGISLATVESAPHGSEQPMASDGAEAPAPLKARGALPDDRDIYAVAVPQFDGAVDLDEAPAPIPIDDQSPFDGPATYDERCYRSVLPAENEYADRDEAPPPRGATPRAPLPPRPDLPESIPGRNLIQALGPELGHLVHLKAHSCASAMLKARSPFDSAEGNAARMGKVWHHAYVNLRRELIRRGATFQQCLIAGSGMAAITSRETADAARYGSFQAAAVVGNVAACTMAN
jgi:hypothetical protein